MVVEANPQRLVRLRVRAAISQAELAAEMGISPRALQYFEAGVRPMARMRDQHDYTAAIDAILARRAAEKAS